MKIEDAQWEVGSEFHWQAPPTGPFIEWPKPHILFATGREAILSVWLFLQSKNIKSLFIPDYFCNEVVSWCLGQGINIQRYADGPHLPEPLWETLDASKGDAVLAVNYFGVRDGKIWRNWRDSNGSVVLIEDHSHDPVSAWALSSKADFAFASLRKTFPAPDGSILWSPRGIPLPCEPLFKNGQGSLLKLTAMLLKKNYLEGGGARIKNLFRSFQIDGEALLGDGDGNLSGISPWSKMLLLPGYPIVWRTQREKNVSLFLDLINGQDLIKPLFNKWPEGHCPFNVVLMFLTQKNREKVRQRLIKNNIYTSVHWDMPLNASASIINFSNRILTIPVDQRYNEDDVKHMVSVILNE